MRPDVRHCYKRKQFILSPTPCDSTRGFMSASRFQVFSRSWAVYQYCLGWSLRYTTVILDRAALLSSQNWKLAAKIAPGTRQESPDSTRTRNRHNRVVEKNLINKLSREAATQQSRTFFRSFRVDQKSENSCKNISQAPQNVPLEKRE